MDLRQYVRVLRAQWVLVVLSVLVCTGAAAALAWTRTDVYEARTQLFVSTGGVPSDLAQTYQGGLFTQQRVRSYARIVSSPAVAQAVVQRLHLSESVPSVQDRITASVPMDSVLIDVEVRHRNRRTARAIANAVGDYFPTFVNNLEQPARGQASPVKVSVTSPARLPTDPVSPRKRLYLAVGILAGLMLGVGGALVREGLDKRIRSDDDATVLGAPVLGRIGDYRKAKKRPLVVASNPFSASAEAYRQLRTNLRALNVDDGLRSLVVSSAVSGEGKTLVVANLGFAFVQAGYRVILVDADLRSPKLAKTIGLEPPKGLTDVLLDNVPLDDALRSPSDLPLDVLASGPRPPNPSELLGSRRFATVLQELMERADIVILDSPALVVTDAAILAQLTSGVLLVARAASTRTDQLENAADSLHAVGDRVLGIVLNRVPAGNRWPYAGSTSG
jgi:succinoglycan biosynthesis transport protein ExoP